jgi:hypothetical protein
MTRTPLTDALVCRAGVMIVPMDHPVVLSRECAQIEQALQEELSRLTTLRPASEHDRKTRVIVYHWTTYADGTAGWVPQWLHNHVPAHCRWMPIPKPKEPTP